MMRIGSEILPVRTFERYKHLYQEPSVVRVLEGFEAVGNLARKHDVRLSSHPGQYSILTSDKPDVVNRAIEDLEYHAEIFRLMGYTSSDQRQEINIHGGARCDDFVDRFLAGRNRLSRDAQQWLSVENDEFSYGLDDLLPLADKVKICVDINHYWIKQGSYLQPDDARMQQVISSWRGARPEIHVAWPHEQVLTDHVDPHQLPDMALLESRGYKRAKLRAHSNDAWIPAIGKYALEFWPMADLCVEAKYKNLASTKLYKMTIST
jgi:UV DNA damage repair endonuclease